MYASAQNRYISFCQHTNATPFPVSVHLLCNFVAFIGSQGLKHQLVKTYLSAVRHAKISAGFPDPFNNSDLSRLEFVLKGLKRQQVYQGARTKSRMPITPDILRSLKRLWDPKAANTEIAMLWAACILGFFGFLRCGEFTCPSGQAYDPSCHLSLSDVAIDSPSNPSLMRVTLKQSKTDPFWKGVDIYLGAVESSLCPIRAMLAYLAIRGQSASPLFIRGGGTPLTRSFLVESLKQPSSNVVLIQTCTMGIASELGLRQLQQPTAYQKPLSKCWEGGRAQHTLSTSRPQEQSWQPSRHAWRQGNPRDCLV